MYCLKGAHGCGIVLRNRGHTHIESYSNANRARSMIDIRSTSRYFVFVGGN